MKQMAEGNGSQLSLRQTPLGLDVVQSVQILESSTFQEELSFTKKKKMAVTDSNCPF